MRRYTFTLKARSLNTCCGCERYTDQMPEADRKGVRGRDGRYCKRPNCWAAHRFCGDCAIGLGLMLANGAAS